MWEKIKSFLAIVGVFFLGLFCRKLFNHGRAAERDTGTDADNQSGSGKDKEREQRITDAGGNIADAGGRIEQGTDAITEASGRIDAIIAEVRRTKINTDND